MKMFNFVQFFDSQMSKFEQQIQKSMKCIIKEEFNSKILIS